MGEQELNELEDQLKRLSGVRGVRVVGNGDLPSEIHIVASRDRPAKQIVRDVQSLAQARFKTPIDHRIVSVVQLEEASPNSDSDAAPVEGRRPVLDQVLVGRTGGSGWVKVTLRWPHGEVTDGERHVDGTREMKARGAALALSEALEPYLSSARARLEVEQLSIQRIGMAEVVLVAVRFSDADGTVPLVGSAVIQDDVSTAAIHAVLQAVNRRLR